MVDVEVSETGCLLQEDFSLESCQPEVEIRNNKIKERTPKIEKKRYLPVLNSFAGTWYEVVHRWGPRGPPASEAGTRSWAEEDWGRDDDDDGDGDDNGDGDGDDDDEEEEKKNCSNISQNLLYCSLSNTSTYIGTPKFLTKALWVYSHLKSDFFSEKKLLNVI